MSSCHHVINSRHFIKKINNINIGPTDLLVSFDVESLFTNVPVTEACDIIKTRLQQDTILDTRTALSPEQIHDLLLTCLNETSFQWRDGYNKQLQGAAMGSPLSPIVANIFMEEFETSALQQATHQPKLWLRYVDDTFIIWQHSKQQLDNFFQHLNNQHSNIKFTMETEDQGSLPFLDVRITKATDGHLIKSTESRRIQTDTFTTDHSTTHQFYNQSPAHSSNRHTTSATSNTFNKNFNTSSLHSPPSTDTLVGRSRYMYGHQDISQPHQPSQESPSPTWARHHTNSNVS